MHLGDYFRAERRLRSTAARYAFGVGAVATALALRLLLLPLTGKGAPFVMFFAATLLTSLLSGPGPALLSLVISVPLIAAVFIVPEGYSVSQVLAQSALYAFDGVIVVYLTILMKRRRLRLEEANRQLRQADEERARSSRRERETIELAPDAYFLADPDARYTDVNRAACRLLGYQRAELIGKTIFELILPEDFDRLKALRAELRAPGQVSKGEWKLKRKDGSLVPVEVSANMLSDGRWQTFARDISERTRIEDLRQVYVALLDNSLDFIGIADPTGKPIYVNPAGRRMIGLAADFPVERTKIEDYYPPELRDFATNVILRTMLERGEWFGETEFQNMSTQEKIPVSDTHFLIRDETGERILGMGTITRDISGAQRTADEREQLLATEQQARQQAESANEQLRESEERFRLTIENAPIGMALVTLEGRFVRVNRALCEITGYSADELTQMSFDDVTHPDDVAADLEAARHLALGEIPRYQREKRYIRKDRSIIDVRLNVSALRAPDGTPRYFISQIEDISLRKEADDALRLSEAKFSGIVSIAADAIISVDADQRILLFNEGAEEIFGYPKSEVLGGALEMLIPERLRAAHAEHFARFAAGEETSRKMAVPLDVFGLRKNGEEFPAEASISKVSVGGTTYFSVVLRDITDRKSVEAALQRAVTARDDVLGIVAHDLRNPLNTIMMQAQLLEQHGPEPERRDQTPRLGILRSAQRMNRLIEDLLDVAVAEAGLLKVERERISAVDLVRDALEAQKALATASGLELELELEAAVHDVWGDRHRLLQVFENLISNALKFTQEGGRITVSAKRTDDVVEFSVADTGCGIAPEALHHIFDRFWQEPARVHRMGAGLGLQITRAIVEAHGGRVRVDSTVNQGSTFFFTIPVVAAEKARPDEIKLLGRPRSQVGEGS